MSDKEQPDITKQRRHWGHTVHYGHVGLDAEEMDDINEDDNGDELDLEVEFTERLRCWWESLIQLPGLRYAVGQLERCPDTNRLHGQVYSEWVGAVRGTTLYRRAPSDLKPKWASRDTCRAYHKKPESRIEKLGEFGEWRIDSVVGELSNKQRALQYVVKDGLRPAEIARLDPEVYFTHHRAITELWQALRFGEGIDNDDVFE